MTKMARKKHVKNKTLTKVVEEGQHEAKQEEEAGFGMLLRPLKQSLKSDNASQRYQTHTHIRWRDRWRRETDR